MVILLVLLVLNFLGEIIRMPPKTNFISEYTPGYNRNRRGSIGRRRKITPTEKSIYTTTTKKELLR